jgi:hypothetical protein
MLCAEKLVQMRGGVREEKAPKIKHRHAESPLVIDAHDARLSLISPIQIGITVNYARMRPVMLKWVSNNNEASARAVDNSDDS